MGGAVALQVLKPLPKLEGVERGAASEEDETEEAEVVAVSTVAPAQQVITPRARPTAAQGAC